MSDPSTPDVQHGHAYLFISLFSGIVAWVNDLTIDQAIRTLSMVISMGAGLMAIRYYYYATKKNKS